jgi:uncharacterized membrane protein
MAENGAGSQGSLLFRFAWSFSPLGLALGTLFFAASLTPSLVPRPPVIQGALGGACLGVGYGIGYAAQTLWRWLGLPSPWRAWRYAAVAAAIGGCALAVGLALWWSAGWQNRLRAVMGMEPIDETGRLTVAATALAVFFVLLAVGWLFGRIARFLSRRLGRYLPVRVALPVAVAITAALFWSIGSGVLVERALRARDYMDYFEISRARDLSGEFDDYLRLKKELELRPRPVRADRVSYYLDTLEKAFESRRRR